MNLKRPDRTKRGGSYAPRGVKRGTRRAPLPVRRIKPKGGWPATVKSERHGPYGSIAKSRRAKGGKK